MEEKVEKEEVEEEILKEEILDKEILEDRMLEEVENPTKKKQKCFSHQGRRGSSLIKVTPNSELAKSKHRYIDILAK